MPISSNGNVIPSVLAMTRRGLISPSGLTSNISFRQGEVKEVIYPADPRSKSGTHREYTVAVKHKRGEGPGATVLYYNCLMTNLFGGVADRYTYALRADTTKTKESTLGNGSKVTLACVNGDTPNAVIIGGINDPTDANPIVEDEDWGRFNRWCYNGLSICIDDDGQAALFFQGKTKADGTLDDSAQTSASGSGLTFLKNGNVILQGPSGTFPQLFIDGNGLAAGAPSITLSAGDQKVLMATTGGLQLGKATDAFVMGTTYRSGESTMNQTLQAQLAALNTAVGGLATAMAAMAAGLGTLAGTLALIPPGAAAAATAATAAGAAAAPLAAMGAAFTAMQSAIAAFEAQAKTYLSTIHNLGP